MKIVLVSAGHSTISPVDSGAVGNGHKESVLALALRDAVAANLREYGGVKVIEDGADGISEPLRKAIALAATADVAVEIHFNASANPTATGIETLAKAKHKKLAQKLCGAIEMATGLKLRGGEGGWRLDSSGQHHRLGFCEAGGLVIEICFISNAKDVAAYLANFQKVAENLARVLAQEVGAAAKPAGTVIGKTHQVESGDTLYSIGRKHSVSVAQLKALNKFDSDDLYVGQILKIN